MPKKQQTEITAFREATKINALNDPKRKKSTSGF
jgi:hypothetical protein